jgi:hypothetical protein
MTRSDEMLDYVFVSAIWITGLGAVVSILLLLIS